MKYFDWNNEKNIKLRKERGVSFEDVIIAVSEGNVIRVEGHYSKRYANQKIIIVNINNYAYLVPYVEDDEKYFLKTVIPSRKATKKHILKI